MLSPRAIFWAGAALTVLVLAGLAAWRSDVLARFVDGQRQSAFRQIQLGHLARLDRNATPGSVVLIGASSVQALYGGAAIPHSLNLGLGGEFVAQTRERVGGYRSLATASCIFVQVGMNDILQGRDPAATARELEGILRLFPQSTRLVLSGLQPLAGSKALQHPAWVGAIADYNRRARAACEARSPCTFLDLAAVLSSDPHCAGHVVHESDGVHLNARGYACWSRAIGEAVAVARR